LYDLGLMRRLFPAAIAVLLLAAAPGHAREPGLWATVNLCDTPAKPSAIGIRVSVPAHGRHLQQWVRIHVEFFDGATWKRVGDAGDAHWRRFGRGRGTVQAGTTFTYPPPPAGQSLILRGAVDVQWRKKHKVRGRAKLPTESGHSSKKDPRLAISQATCEIKR
jgi:hypothetical protein